MRLVMLFLEPGGGLGGVAGGALGVSGESGGDALTTQVLRRCGQSNVQLAKPRSCSISQISNRSTCCSGQAVSRTVSSPSQTDHAMQRIDASVRENKLPKIRSSTGSWIPACCCIQSYFQTEDTAVLSDWRLLAVCKMNRLECVLFKLSSRFW